MLVVHIVFVNDLEEVESHTVIVDGHPLLCEYVDVFLDEIPATPPQRGIDFWIDLVLGVELIS